MKTEGAILSSILFWHKFRGVLQIDSIKRELGIEIDILGSLVDFFITRDKILCMVSKKFFRWLPAILMMAAIFTFSSIPSDSLPNFDFWDRLVKKGGHMLGYSFLALSYWYALRKKNRRLLLAWLLAVLFAVSDEFHQSWVPGRHPSVSDVLIFDNLGAAIGMLFAALYSKDRE